MQRRYLRHSLACLCLLLFLSSCGGSGSEDLTTTTGSSDTSDANTVYDVSDISLDDTETGDDTSTSDAESVVTIVLADTGISISPEGSGASASGAILTISQPGTYLISGSLTNGQIIVDSDDDGTIYLQLDGISIINQSGSPFFISSADEVSIELMSGSSNYLQDTDEDNYTFEEGEDEPDAALFSKEDLTINGSGSMTVVGNFNEAIKSKDGLTISAVTLNVTSVDDGIQGKDYLTINGADITINAAGDGLKSSNDDDETVGYIYLKDATLDITSGADGIQAESYLYIESAVINMTTASGSAYTVSDDDSAKGLKAGTALQINTGTFTLDCADDAIHSNDTILIYDGTYTIESGDDGIHSDSALQINGGTIDINKAYEGLESSNIIINNGNISVISRDDGINISGGSDGSSNGSFNSSDGGTLFINGGWIAIYSKGDGLDANGSIEMSGGTVLVHGPTSSNESAIDYDNNFYIDGGLLIATGPSSMSQAPERASTQHSIKASFSTQTIGTLVHLQTTSGTAIASFTPGYSYSSVVISAPELSTGTSYTLYLGGSNSGTQTDGLYEGGSYSTGTSFLSKTFSLSSMTTSVSVP